MPFAIDIEKVKLLMHDQGLKRNHDLYNKLVDIDQHSFWTIMNNRSKNVRTTLNITVRIAKALQVQVEEIIKEIP